MRGRVRFGASEDFVSSRLPEVLGDFVRLHPLVDLELTVDLSATLYQMLDAGDIDVVLCKRRAGDDRGRLVWRDLLAWIGTEATRISTQRSRCLRSSTRRPASRGPWRWKAWSAPAGRGGLSAQVAA